MNYYKIAPATLSYRGDDLLTYKSELTHQIGQVVAVKIRGRSFNGFIVEKTTKPDFDCADISSFVPDLIIPKDTVSFFRKFIDYYPNYIGNSALLFLPTNTQPKTHEPTQTSELNINFASQPKLNHEQQQALSKIDTNEAKTILVRGETGSGKTRLYLELVKNTVESGRSVIVLTPEISLAQPLSEKFEEVFGEIVSTNHSELTKKNRVSVWNKLISANNPQILIGPRSSLFMPISNVGLIIIDECHDTAYKQESAPYYHAIRAAGILAKNSGAKLILGSATPSVTDYYYATTKNVPIVKLDLQAITGKIKSSRVKVVDLSSKNEQTSYSFLTKSLIEEIKKQLDSGGQSMLFLNRRGSARAIVCNECGWRASCPNCDLPLTYHHDQHKLICHTCSFSRSPMQECPDCGSTDIFFKSPGTKMIAENLSKIFPDAKIIRYDKDNKKSERMAQTYSQLSAGDFDIIVGTQIITKGHDLPNLGLVAMLQTESGLEFPDYSSAEKSYQLVKQFSGRVDRGHSNKKGLVLLQTFNPKSNVISLATEKSYEHFYQNEIEHRKKHDFPPFCHALKIRSSRKSQKSAIESLDKLLATTLINNRRIKILGPSPCFIEKKSGNFEWQIIITARDRIELTKLSRSIKGNFRLDLDPVNFL